MTTSSDRAEVPEVVYHGYRHADATRTALIAIESPDSDIVAMLHPIDRHRPAEFNWGYAGKGPATTARTLLISALGPAAVCGVCRGTGLVAAIDPSSATASLVPFDSEHHHEESAWECECEDGWAVSPSLYQAFKREVVAGLEPEWHLSRTSILTWVSDHVAEHA